MLNTLKKEKERRQILEVKPSFLFKHTYKSQPMTLFLQKKYIKKQHTKIEVLVEHIEKIMKHLKVEMQLKLKALEEGERHRKQIINLKEKIAHQNQRLVAEKRSANMLCKS